MTHSEIREEFPLLQSGVDGKKLIYLDSACTALKMRRTAESLRRFYLEEGGCGGSRASHFLGRRAQGLLDESRREAARFLNAEKPEEIVFTSGATDGINLVARAFPFTPKRNEVIISESEHNSLFLPFKEAEGRGKIRLTINSDLNALERRITDKTALVAMARSSNVLGGDVPAAKIAALAHRKGAKVLFDDAQFLSSHREDVRASDADFVVFSGHKLGGPFGVGVLYGKEHLLNGLQNNAVGGGTIKELRDGYPVYLDAPQRFEPGVPDFAGAAALAETLRFLGDLDWAAARARTRALVSRALEGLKKHPEIMILGDEKTLLEGALLSFYSLRPDFSLKDFNLFLNHELKDRMIAVRVGEHCAHLLYQRRGIPATMRLSFFVYSSEEEVDSFLDALGAYLEGIRS